MRWEQCVGCAVRTSFAALGLDALGLDAVPVRQWLPAYLAMEFASGCWLAFFFQVSHLSDALDYSLRAFFLPGTLLPLLHTHRAGVR